MGRKKGDPPTKTSLVKGTERAKEFAQRGLEARRRKKFLRAADPVIAELERKMRELVNVG